MDSGLGKAVPLHQILFLIYFLFVSICVVPTPPMEWRFLRTHLTLPMGAAGSDPAIVSYKTQM